jgi:hypothetical protein
MPRVAAAQALPPPSGLSGADVAALAFFAILYTNAAVVASQFWGVPYTVAASFVALLAIPLTTYLVIKREPLVVTPALPFVFAFVAAVCIATVFSAEPAVARQWVFMYLTEGLLLFLLVLNAVRTTALLHRIAWVLIIASAALGALSVLQEVTHSYGSNFRGFAQVDRVDEGGGFSLGENVLGQKELRPRLSGPIGSENRYAQILIVVFPLAFLRAWAERRRGRRVAAGVCSVLILGGILLTFSRGAAVALALLFVALLAFRAIPVRKLAAVVAVGTALVFLFVPEYTVRLNSLSGVTALDSSQPSEADAAIRGRQTENLAALNTFLDHPIAGVGPGVYFKRYSQQYANEQDIRYLTGERRAHSLYLEMAADMGLVGLATFLLMVGVTLYHLHRARRYWRGRRPDHELLAASLFFALLAYLTTALFLHLSYMRYFWVLLALANCVIWALAREQQAARKPTARRSAPA